MISRRKDSTGTASERSIVSIGKSLVMANADFLRCRSEGCADYVRFEIWTLTVVSSKPEPEVSWPISAAGTEMVWVRTPPAVLGGEISAPPRVKLGTLMLMKFFGSAMLSTHLRLTE